MKTFTAEALRSLPPKYRHMAPELRTVPANDIAHCILACAHVGFTDDAIAGALHTLAEHHKQSGHRCSACLAWAKGDGAIHGGYVDSDGRFAVVTVCARCQRLIAAGRATPTMERNLLAYGLGRDEVVR